MADHDCKASMRATLEHIKETLENPPMVDEDGHELPDDTVECEDYRGAPLYVTGWDRKVPASEAPEYMTEEGTKEGAYAYSEEDDTITCRATGQAWEGFERGYFYGYDGSLILGGDTVNDVRPMSGFDFLVDALDITYMVSGEGDYRGADVLVGFGGPNIGIDTKRRRVWGAWWGDTDEVFYHDEMGLDEALEELWGCR